jgi:RNA-directed DNA polymerase
MRRFTHRKRGGATYRIIRYADDFTIMVNGAKAQADALWDEVAELLAPLGLRLSETKSRVCHLDEGFDFLGVRHEAPSIRVEVKDRHRCAVAAA